MKRVHILSGLAVAIALAGCAQERSEQVPAPTTQGSTIAGTTAQNDLRLPNVSGSVWLKQNVVLPPHAVLTVTLSDASLADAPSKVLTQRAVRTEGKQAPFTFILPFDPSDVKPNARILLSAAITVDDKLMFITDAIQPVVNNGVTKADVTLVPVQQTAVPVKSGASAVNQNSMLSGSQQNGSASTPTLY
ncbi:hypothetical protein GIX45_19805 [Erwinia sp. CPCC 100877]|nr:hypothetical protein [Erwinia sp. CPCC 100877]